MTKKYIIQNFSRASETYSEFSSIQDLAGENLLKLIDIFPQKILEIGCGPANFTQKLQQKFPNTQITAIDISPKMIDNAKLKNIKNTKFLQLDAENLQINEKFDLIISNSTFQWFTNLKKNIENYKKMLNTNGKIIFSMFGNKTFTELAEILNQYNIKIPAQNFKNINKIKQICNNDFQITDEIIQKEYPSIYELLKKIKNTGTKTHQISLNNQIWTKQKIQNIEKNYLQKFGKIIVTYELIFGISNPITFHS